MPEDETQPAWRLQLREDREEILGRPWQAAPGAEAWARAAGATENLSYLSGWWTAINGRCSCGRWQGEEDAG